MYAVIIKMGETMQLIIYTVLGFVGLFAVATIYRRTKEHFIRRSRLEETKEEFLQYFEDNGLSTVLASSVHEYLIDWMNRIDFPVRPNDKFADIYGIVDEDLDDLVIGIAHVNNLVVPSDTSYWQSPVVTIEDLVRFISSFTRESQL